jgi:hypothetical protein
MSKEPLMKGIRGIVVALVLIAPAGNVHAASRQALNRCGDAVRTMKMASSKQYKGRNISPLETKNALAHFKQVAESWKRAQAQLGQIPKEELDWEDLGLQECRVALGEWQTYIGELKQKISGAAAGATAHEPFLAAVQPHRSAFLVLAAAHLNPAADVFNGRDAASERSWLESAGT